MQYRQILPLLFLALLVQCVFAEASCSDIQLSTSTVRVERGSEKTEYFFIDNHSSERFFVDSVEVSDNVSGIIAMENGFDRTIEAFSYGVIGVRVKALEDVSVSRAQATLRVRGHFLSGRECTFQNLGTRNFDIIVEERPTSGHVSSSQSPMFRSCPGVVLDNPTEFSTGSDYLRLYIDNDTNYRVAIRMHGEGLTVNPSVISVPKYTDFTEYLWVDSDRAATWPHYDVDSPVCSGLEGTRVFKGESTLSAPGTPVSIEHLSDIVDLKVETRSTDSNLTAIVSLENKSNETVSGKLLFDISGGDWTIEGNRDVSIPPREKIVREFALVPKQPVTQSVSGKVSFRVEEEISKNFSIVPLQTETGQNAPRAPTAFFALYSLVFGSWLFWLVLLIVVVMVVWLFVQGRKRIRLDDRERWVIRQ